MDAASAVAKFGRKVGLTMHIGCFCTVVIWTGFLAMLVAAGSKESWWDMCATVPCGALSMPYRHSELQSCAHSPSGDSYDSPDDVGLAAKLVQDRMPANRNLDRECEAEGHEVKGRDCDAYKCYTMLEFLKSSTESEGDVACLEQLQQSNGEYVTFGSLCCSACRHGTYGDLEAVFRVWSKRGQSCGLFQCIQSHKPANDFCPKRASYARTAQGFTVLSLFGMAFLVVFHATELFALPRSSGSKRLPMPHCVTTTREVLRNWGHWIHYFTGFLLFIASIFWVATLSLDFCGHRMANYVEPRFGVRLMWANTCIAFVIGCYYHLSVIGYAGVSRLVRIAEASDARSAMPAVPIGAMGSSALEAHQPHVHRSPGEHAVTDIELRAPAEAGGPRAESPGVASPPALTS